MPSPSIQDALRAQFEELQAENGALSREYDRLRGRCEELERALAKANDDGAKWLRIADAAVWWATCAHSHDLNPLVACDACSELRRRALGDKAPPE